MPGSKYARARVGRLLLASERQARMADEAAATIEQEGLRTAFAISNRHVLTAWHCVNGVTAAGQWWFRLRQIGPDRTYCYLPLRVTHYDEAYDVAVLTVDLPRFGEADLSHAKATRILGEAAIPLGTKVKAGDDARIVGFPASATTADCDTNDARVIDPLDIGDVIGLKLHSDAFAAVSPVDPHGLSGGPVLLRRKEPSGGYVAVGVVRAVPSGLIPGYAAGGNLIATRIKDLIDRLPEVAVALREPLEARSRGRDLGAARASNALTVSQACGRMLRETLVRVHDPDLGTLTGWPHFFNEPPEHRRPTAIGTAYGLKLALLLGDRDSGIDRSALAATLWRLRRKDGGWAARTGSGFSRPEVSALVLGALAACGFDPDKLADAGEAFEQALPPAVDPALVDRTYLLSAVMRGLARAFPHSPTLARLRETLLTGAIHDGDLLCWPQQLHADDGRRQTPSAASTAQAIIALVRADQVLGQDTRSKSALDQAVQWLVARKVLANDHEQIRRFVADGQPWELGAVRHFTAAWVARALLAAPGDSQDTEALLEDAARRVWRSYREGCWEWDNGERPLWMAYQGAYVVRDFAMRAWATW
jgi:Trypsin-like peptidase domain